MCYLIFRNIFLESSIHISQDYSFNSHRPQNLRYLLYRTNGIY
jgi:hypothetical protein